MAHGSYKKWLRYDLDFRAKCHFPAQHGESLFEFPGKLEEKRQSKAQQEQPASAIGLFYEIYREKPPSQKPLMAIGLGGATPRETFPEDPTQMRGCLEGQGLGRDGSSGMPRLPRVDASGASGG
jgi:hypothetical protein